jgi:hypothetical protein
MIKSSQGEGKGMASNRNGARRLAFVAAGVTVVVACGAGWAVSVNGETDSPRVSIQTEQPATRDEMIQTWRRLLARHDQQLPDTSELSTEEIRSRWQQDRVRYADATGDDMTVDPCKGVKGLFDPDCW